MSGRIAWSDVRQADLVVDAVYESGPTSRLDSEVISKLLPGMGNAAGFRYAGSADSCRVVVLFTNGTEPNWPDELDLYRGVFRY